VVYASQTPSATVLRILALFAELDRPLAISVTSAHEIFVVMRVGTAALTQKRALSAGTVAPYVVLEIDGWTEPWSEAGPETMSSTCR